MKWFAFQSVGKLYTSRASDQSHRLIGLVYRVRFVTNEELFATGRTGEKARLLVLSQELADCTPAPQR